MCPKNKAKEKKVKTISYAYVIESLMYAMISTKFDICHTVALVSYY